MPPAPEILTLTVDHTTYTIKSMPAEYDNIRLWAISKQYPRSEADYQSACNIALYWYYRHKLNCTYNAAIQRKIDCIDLDE